MTEGSDLDTVQERMERHKVSRTYDHFRTVRVSFASSASFDSLYSVIIR